MTVEEKFWNWFKRHEQELFNFEVDRENIFSKVAAELGQIDPNLTFEFGPRQDTREFVISAGGIKDSFPAVISLSKAAPPLPHWRITAFRPRRTPLNTIEFRGKSVDPKSVEFTLLDNGQMAGLYLFIPGLQEGDADYKMIGYLLLDEVLGEYDVETGLGLIEMHPLPSSKGGKRYPLSTLSSAFDTLVSQFSRTNSDAFITQKFAL